MELVTYTQSLNQTDDLSISIWLNRSLLGRNDIKRVPREQNPFFLSYQISHSDSFGELSGEAKNPIVGWPFWECKSWKMEVFSSKDGRESWILLSEKLLLGGQILEEIETHLKIINLYRSRKIREVLLVKV